MVTMRTHTHVEARPPISFIGKDPVDLQPLSPWNQTSLRCYTQNILCFPFQDDALGAATTHLAASLARLAKQRPDFAGRLQLGSGPSRGYLYLRRSPSQAIPLEVFAIHETFGWTYQQLKEAGFPPGAFVHDRFAADGGLERPGTLVPVFKLRAFFIRGGLLLSVAFHHAFSDGDCVRMFLECLAAQTWSRAIDHPASLQLQLDPPPNGISAPKANGRSKFELLMDRCPEYSPLPDCSGPTTPCLQPGGTPVGDIPKTGRVFVFSNKRLKDLARIIEDHGDGSFAGPPSSYTCLAALTWAHVARARIESESYLGPQSRGAASNPTNLGHRTDSWSALTAVGGHTNTISNGNGDRNNRPANARLYTPVNWKPRVQQPSAAAYYGNATAVPMTTIPISDLLLASAPAQSAASPPSHLPATSEDVRASHAALSRLAHMIEATIHGVDDAFVRVRMALFEAAPDPRLIGLAFDPRTPQDLGFNTWRHFAADTRWCIPGVVGGATGARKGSALDGDCQGKENGTPGGARVGVDCAEQETDGGEEDSCKPDAICRAQGAWNMAGALILPARATSTCHELLVTLPVVSMERLCQDEGWLRWVEKVVG